MLISFCIYYRLLSYCFVLWDIVPWLWRNDVLFKHVLLCSWNDKTVVTLVALPDVTLLQLGWQQVDWWQHEFQTMEFIIRACVILEKPTAPSKYLFAEHWWLYVLLGLLQNLSTLLHPVHIQHMLPCFNVLIIAMLTIRYLRSLFNTMLTSFLQN